jgi:hypothetical protein
MNFLNLFFSYFTLSFTLTLIPNKIIIRKNQSVKSEASKSQNRISRLFKDKFSFQFLTENVCYLFLIQFWFDTISFTVENLTFSFIFVHFNTFCYFSLSKVLCNICCILPQSRTLNTIIRLFERVHENFSTFIFDTSLFISLMKEEKKYKVMFTIQVEIGIGIHIMGCERRLTIILLMRFNVALC